MSRVDGLGVRRAPLLASYSTLLRFEFKILFVV